MTEIPIKKKGGSLWWLWLILAVIVIALLVWLFAGRDRGEDVTTTPTASAPATDYGASGGTMAPRSGPAGAADTTPITDLAALLDAPTDTVVGRQVRLTNVPAGTVPADAGFWITGDDGKREYVILHEVRTPNTPIEGKIDVDQGDHLDIVGTVRSAAEGVPKDAAIPGPTAPLPGGVEHYIDAQSVTKTR